MVRDGPPVAPPVAGVVLAAGSRRRAGMWSWSGSALPARRPVDGKDAELRSARSRDPQIGNSIRDQMPSLPQASAPGVDQAWGRLSRGESMGGAGWGDPIGSALRGTEQLRVHWRWTPQPSAADKAPAAGGAEGGPQRGRGWDGRRGRAGGWDKGVAKPLGLRSSNRTQEAASENAQGHGGQPRPHLGGHPFPSTDTVASGTPTATRSAARRPACVARAAGAGEAGLRAQGPRLTG